MRFERGPFGRIAVKTVESETDVVLHTLDVLQNHIISSILPVYIREQMGKIQLCIDCTGYVQLSEIADHKWTNELDKKKCIVEFLRTIIDTQDHFIDIRSFVMKAEYVFFDPELQKLYWCCLPLCEADTDDQQNAYSIFYKNLELLLMLPFFSDVLEEDDRNQLLCMFRDNQEDDLLNYLSDFADGNAAGPHAKQKAGHLVSRLLIQIVFMIFSFALLIYLEVPYPDIFFRNSWTGWYVLFYSFFLLINLMFGQAKDGDSVAQSQIREREAKETLSRKEMYFPSGNNTNNPGEKFSKESHNVQFSPAFLTQQMSRDSAVKKPQRAVIWVTDFLIGRDKSLCDLFVDHPSISDRHARILRRGSLYFLVDLGSATGTVLGSSRLYSFEESPITDGDSFLCGDIRFVFNHIP